MGKCNFCKIKEYRTKAKLEGSTVVLKSSSFMNGVNIFVIPKGEHMPESYIEPCNLFPNGDNQYQKFHISWMMEIGDRCEC
jgi:hypothetical protein